MTGRERLQRALRHEEGPVPMDFGSTAVTGVHVSVVAELRDALGLEPRPVKVLEPYQMLGLMEDDLRHALGLHVVGLPARNTMFGFPNEDWKPFRTPWGQEVLVAGQFVVSHKDNGLYIYPEGDTSVPPSGHMPTSGFFFDTIVRQVELDEEQLDPQDNLEEFGPLSSQDLHHYARELERLEATQQGIVATLGGMALGDIALVPGPFMKHPRGLRDISEWYMATAIHQDVVRAIFERQVEIALENLARLQPVLGDRVDAVFLCGTDFGTQHGSFCSPSTFDELWLPFYRTINDWIHRNTSWKTFKHSCGAVANFMDGFIRAGFDIINPVQCSASGMEPEGLKQRFGDRLVFWGGGVDTQHTLPFGTPREVRQQVLERCRLFSNGGGFVFNAIHNIQAQTPVANVLAMVEAVREFNGA